MPPMDPAIIDRIVLPMECITYRLREHQGSSRKAVTVEILVEMRISMRYANHNSIASKIQTSCIIIHFISLYSTRKQGNIALGVRNPRLPVEGQDLVVPLNQPMPHKLLAGSTTCCFSVPCLLIAIFNQNSSNSGQCVSLVLSVSFQLSYIICDLKRPLYCQTRALY